EPRPEIVPHPRRFFSSGAAERRAGAGPGGCWHAGRLDQEVRQRACVRVTNRAQRRGIGSARSAAHVTRRHSMGKRACRSRAARNKMTPEIDILVSEVGPRDGLQSIKRAMPTAVKNRWITALAAAGLREIEVGSFVSPKLLPQMADAEEVVKEAVKIPG